MVAKNLRNDASVDPLSGEEQRLLDERIAELEADPEGGTPWEEVDARLRGLLKGHTVTILPAF